MDNSKKNPDDGVLNWQNFKQLLGNNFPFPVPDKFDDLSWIEGYVQDAMNRMMPQPIRKGSKTDSFRMEMFETHKNLIVKINLPEAQARNLNVSVGVNNVKLNGIPGSPNKSIKLPAHVLPETCVAVFKDGVLQLHMRKEEFDDYYRNVKIKFTK